MAGRHGANDPERYDGYYTSVPQHQEAKKSLATFCLAQNAPPETKIRLWAGLGVSMAPRHRVREKALAHFRRWFPDTGHGQVCFGLFFFIVGTRGASNSPETLHEIVVPGVR